MIWLLINFIMIRMGFSVLVSDLIVAKAIEEFKEALLSIDVADKTRELDIRYDLMLSLMEHARAENDPGLAREARDICSNIARKNIGYRDIRVRRSEVGQLLKDLDGKSSSE